MIDQKQLPLIQQKVKITPIKPNSTLKSCFGQVILSEDDHLRIQTPKTIILKDTLPDQDVIIEYKLKDAQYELHTKIHKLLTEEDSSEAKGHYILILRNHQHVKRNQRRDFVRVEMNRDARVAICSVKSKQSEHELKEILKIKNTMVKILDMSAGGVKFLSKTKFQPEENLLIELPLNEKFIVVGKVLRNMISKTDPQKYEHSIQFIHMDPKLQNQIVSSIHKLQIQSSRAPKL